MTYRPVRPAIRRTAAEFSAYLFAPAAELRCEAAGDGGCVLVLPAIGRGDAYTARFRAALDAAGFRSAGWGLGVNLGPTARLLAGAAARTLELAAEHGPVDVVGFSMGGLFARWLALEHPASVRRIVTVCSPFREPLASAFLPVRPLAPLWAGAERLAVRVAARPPAPVTSIYTRRDGIVAWRSCIDPDAPEDCFEIDGAHVTIAQDPAVLSIVSRRLS
jgi:pimeloyl-ACP methyl ester carboxylesterase